MTMVRQRVHALALGYEGLNDQDAIRNDPVVQTACERDETLAGSSTLCRFEQRAERQWAIAIHRELLEQFIASFAHPPGELVLDFDATDDPIHLLRGSQARGHQPGRFFHVKRHPDLRIKATSTITHRCRAIVMVRITASS